MSRNDRDWFAILISIPPLIGVGIVLWLFIDVIFLGGGNACPLNLCP